MWCSLDVHTYSYLLQKVQTGTHRHNSQMYYLVKYNQSSGTSRSGPSGAATLLNLRFKASTRSLRVLGHI